ncbi:ParB/RepB/Spo0J family partition protein [Streptomyces sp. SM12]|uniref:ParB/RepB/Spo0J family partition protein n=1 Tax=Streptomyces sp. SM12 TaxID=1071602 RepID=UPI000CD4AC61|nr:ParB/RepB/Spo0J family partition protein [Streptomyces sp. SM12]
MSRKPGLGGKSLAEKRKERREAADRLIPTATSSRVPLGQLMPSPTNGRVELLKIDDLAESLRTEGMGTAITVLEPAVYVQAYPEHKEVVEQAVADGVRYVVHHGHRRLAAAKLAGLADVPVLVRSDEIPSLRIAAIAENLARMSLNPIEEAIEFQQALGEAGPDGKTLSQREFARRVGCSQTYVSHRLALLKLVPSLQQAVVNRWRQDEGLPTDDGELMLTIREGASLYARLREDVQEAFVAGEISAETAAAISKLPQDEQTTTPPESDAPAGAPATQAAPTAEQTTDTVTPTSALDVPTQRDTPTSAPATTDAAPANAERANPDEARADSAARKIALHCEGTVEDIAQAISDLCTAEEAAQIGLLLQPDAAVSEHN